MGDYKTLLALGLEIKHFVLECIYGAEKWFKDRWLDIKEHPLKSTVEIVFWLFCWILQFVGTGGTISIVTGGLAFLREPGVMKTMWNIGFIISVSALLYYYYKSKRGSRQFVLMPWLVLLSLGFMFRYRDIPSIQKHGFSQGENNDTLRTFMHDYERSQMPLVLKAIDIYKKGDFAWSYIYFNTAMNNDKTMKLNQFLPYYIGDLLFLGKDGEANERENELYFLLDSSSNTNNGIFSRDGSLLDLLAKIDEAKVMIPSQKEYYRTMEERLFNKLKNQQSHP